MSIVAGGRRESQVQSLETFAMSIAKGVLLYNLRLLLSHQSGYNCKSYRTTHWQGCRGKRQKLTGNVSKSVIFIAPPKHCLATLSQV